MDSVNESTPVGLKQKGFIETRGAHVIAEYHGCDPERLNHEKTIRRMLQRAADAAGSTVLQIHVRQYAPQGFAGVAVLADSHLSVHTWPEAGYAAADLYTCGRGEPRRAHDVMRIELAAQRAELIEIARGLPSDGRSLAILSTEEETYGQRPTIRIDGRDGRRHGVVIARAPDGQLRLEAERHFERGETVFPLESMLYRSDADFLLETDFGPVCLGIDWDWLDLSVKWFERIPAELADRLCVLYSLPSRDWEELFRLMTSDGTRTRVVATFGEVARHSSNPNVVPVIGRLTREAGAVLALPFQAARPIDAGEEIVWDYCTLDTSRIAEI
jgi:S-adenosylmethionine decarboxylase proenzyme